MPRSDWYRPGRLWKMVLIPEENTEEIERLLALSPPDLKSSTTQNAWLKLPQ